MERKAIALSLTSEITDLDWSIGPIITLMRIIGLDLNWSMSTSTWRQWSSVFFGLIVLVANVVFEMYLMVVLSSNISRVSNIYGWADGQSWTSSLHIFIDYANYTLHTLSVHLIVCSFSRKRWPELKTSVRSVQSHLKAIPFGRLRKLSIALLLYVITTVRSVFCFIRTFK
jgi:hypothetical protein